jgi:hypothetical protein
MLTYSRWAPPDSVDATVEHVRAHLSSVADVDDSPDTHADDVMIEFRPAVNEWGVDGYLVKGSLDAEPDAPYLRDGFDPEQDVEDNPLTVTSISEGAE